MQRHIHMGASSSPSYSSSSPALLHAWESSKTGPTWESQAMAATGEVKKQLKEFCFISVRSSFIHSEVSLIYQHPCLATRVRQHKQGSRVVFLHTLSWLVPQGQKLSQHSWGSPSGRQSYVWVLNQTAIPCWGSRPVKDGASGLCWKPTATVQLLVFSEGHGAVLPPTLVTLLTGK